MEKESKKKKKIPTFMCTNVPWTSSNQLSRLIERIPSRVSTPGMWMSKRETSSSLISASAAVSVSLVAVVVVVPLLLRARSPDSDT